MRQKSVFFVFWSLFSGALLSAAGIELANVAVGSSLQTTATFKLTEPAPDGGLEVTITSEDSNRLKLSRRPEIPHRFRLASEQMIIGVLQGSRPLFDFPIEVFRARDH